MISCWYTRNPRVFPTRAITYWLYMLNLIAGEETKFSFKQSPLSGLFFSGNKCNLMRFTNRDVLNWHSSILEHTIFDYHFGTIQIALRGQLWSLKWSRRFGKTFYCSPFSQASFICDIEDNVNYTIMAEEKTMAVLKKESRQYFNSHSAILYSALEPWVEFGRT